MLSHQWMQLIPGCWLAVVNLKREQSFMLTLAAASAKKSSFSIVRKSVK